MATLERLPVVPILVGAGVLGALVWLARRPRDLAPTPDPQRDSETTGGGGTLTGPATREGDHVQVPEAALTSTTYGLGMTPETKRLWGIMPNDIVVIKVAPGSTNDRVNGVVVGVVRGGVELPFGPLDPRLMSMGRSFTFLRNLITKVTPREAIPLLPVSVGDTVEVEVRSLTSPRRPGGAAAFGLAPVQHVHMLVTGVDPYTVGGPVRELARFGVDIGNITWFAPRTAVLSISPAPPEEPPGGRPLTPNTGWLRRMG